MEGANAIADMYEEAKTLRAPREPDWKLAAAHCLPRHHGPWAGGSANNVQGESTGGARRIAYDTTGIRSLPKYAAVLQRMATPRSQAWHTLSVSNPALNKLRPVQMFFDSLTAMLFRRRYEPKARFEQASTEVYSSLGVYGTGPKFVGVRNPSPTDSTGGILYKACPMRDIFMLVDDSDSVTMVFRRFWLNARQFKSKFGEGANVPRSVEAELKKPRPSEKTTFEFVHVVGTKSAKDYDPEAFDNRRFPVEGAYLAVEDKSFVIEDEGYLSFPYLTPRTGTYPGDPYGFSPAMNALSALGTASAAKKSYLKMGQRAADQVLLAPDDGVMNGQVNLNPGSVNYGGVDATGNRLIHALPSGDFRVAEGILADERRDIEDSFFVTLFQILQDSPEMTATEVISRAAEKSALLAPTMGRLQTEYLGPNIAREIDVLSELGVLPEIPPELIEAAGEYDITYTSPLAKAQFSDEISGFVRTFEVAANAAQVQGDPSLLDHFDLDVAIPEIADRQATPTRWMRSAKGVAAVRAARAEQQQATQALQVAPLALEAAKVAQGG
ncbi:MAG: hypothetical protein KAR40_15300 [Candidatus Sabulitectum sp.]|nr:hypothetical protein [Candidatus Sabulitectum sp.]